MNGNSIINLIGTGMDGALIRHNYISNNIANVDTPNYKRKDHNFIEVLQKNTASNTQLSLRKTNPKHIQAGLTSTSGTAKDLLLNSRTSYRNDGNNVDIDVEMGEQVKNALYYNTLTKQINDRFSILKNVISKGGR